MNFSPKKALCRVCHEIDLKNNLQKACDCGKYYHFLCLTHFMQTNKTDFCRKCQKQFKGIEYTKRDKHLTQFLKQKHIFWSILRILVEINTIIVLFGDIRSKINGLLRNDWQISGQFWTNILIPSICFLIELKSFLFSNTFIELWIEYKEWRKINLEIKVDNILKIKE